VCPYLRLDADGMLGEPAGEPTEDHRCLAIGGPVVLSPQQQRLVCLVGAHVDCPRYHRVPKPRPARRRTIRTPAVPRAIAASLVVLAVSAVVSFGFVMHRGGIDLTAGTSAGPGDAAAVIATRAPASPADTPAASPAPTEAPTPVATQVPSPQAAATAAPRPSPAPSATPRPAPTPRPTPAAAAGTASASRLAVLKPCPGQAGCYVYTVRAGDNLFSIAHWFGVPLSSIYTMNPTVQRSGIHPGMQLRIPTPTR
jgi:hypothetical protein